MCALLIEYLVWSPYNTQHPVESSQYCVLMGCSPILHISKARLTSAVPAGVGPFYLRMSMAEVLWVHVREGLLGSGAPMPSSVLMGHLCST